MHLEWFDFSVPLSQPYIPKITKQQVKTKEVYHNEKTTYVGVLIYQLIAQNQTTVLLNMHLILCDTFFVCFF